MVLLSLIAFFVMVVAAALAAPALLRHKRNLNVAKKHRRLLCAPPAVGAAHYVFFEDAEAAGAVVVDCTHPSCPTFTHHKGHNNPPGLAPSDTSTGLILNAVRDGTAADWLSRPAVAVNHFDGDALFSVWAYIHRAEAQKHDELLRAAAALHDFREMPAVAGPGPGPSPLALRALSLCAWINSVERNQFSPPYEDKDADEKFAFFLRELGPFLESPEKAGAVWEEEYTQVLADWRIIAEEGRVEVRAGGVAIVECPRPVHYYALFSHSLGSDVVVSKWVSLPSRPPPSPLPPGEARN